MKHKFSFCFPAARRSRRPRGQYLAAAALMLALAAVGTASVSLSASQPQALAVQPETVSYKLQETQEQAGDAWVPGAATSIPEQEVPAQPEPAFPDAVPQQPAAEQGAAERPAADAERPAGGTDGPATEGNLPQQETPAQPAANPEDTVALAQPAEGQASAAPATGAILLQSTPELAAEDQEAGVRLEEMEPTNGQPAEAQPEDALPAPVEGQDGEIVLVTPEQLGSLGTGPEDEAALGEENCLAWLLEYFFGIGRSGWHRSWSNTYYYDPQTHEKVTGVQVIDGKLYCFDSDGILQEDVTFGVDVSKYQSSVDWEKLKKAGVEFAILRIGYRGYETGAMVLDSMYETHMANATAAGLRTGVYFFSQAVNEAEALEEAEAVLYVLDVLGHSVQYPVYFDSEYATSNHKGRADGLTREQRTACAVAFCERIQQAGLRAGVYASTNWFRDKLDYNTVSRYSIWNAHYGVAESPLGCELWQCTGTGTLDGVKGQIDINVSYIG